MHCAHRMGTRTVVRLTCERVIVAGSVLATLAAIGSGRQRTRPRRHAACELLFWRWKPIHVELGKSERVKRSAAARAPSLRMTAATDRARTATSG
jgi:hypothetical protein